MQMHVNLIEGKIVITFGALISWISFSEDDARRFVKSLEELLAQIELAKNAGKTN
jgi:hypothetical protein